MKKIMFSAFLIGTLLCIGQHAIAAETKCRAFSTSGWDGEQGYANCTQCLRHNHHCETRCFDTQFTCTVSGEDQYGTHTTLQGPRKKSGQRAEKKALQRCRQQGLNACVVTHCTEENVVQPGSVATCQSQPTGYVDSYMDWADNNSRRNIRGPARCGIFPTFSQTFQHQYSNCNACVKRHGQCEERCTEPAYICTANGYNRAGFWKTIQGNTAKNQQKAERKAMRKCYNAGLNGCAIDQCSETMQFDQMQVTPCRNQTNRYRGRSRHLPQNGPTIW